MPPYERRGARIHVDGLVAKCRIGISQKFGLRDRLRFLFRGRLWVVTINGKEHTTVTLALNRPEDK